MKSAKGILFGFILTSIAVGCMLMIYHKDSITLGLQRRLNMGHPVETELHKRNIRYKHAAVAADNEICSEVGRDTLKKGGSAVDAAIAAMLCLGVINSHSTGIGGGGFMLVYDKRHEKGEVIDFREAAPIHSNRNLFRGDPLNGIRGGLAVAVPGELRGMEAAWKKYGKLPWKTLFQPAIKLAREGFKMPETLSIATHKWERYVTSNKCMREIYAHKGKLLKTGDKMENKKLANTLEAIANAGNADSFYTGKMAETIVKEVKEMKGILTPQDLKEYRAVIRKPLISKLGTHTILNTPPPASGPVLALILNILKGYKFKSTDYQENPQLVLHRIIETFKFAYGQRTLLADPDIEKNVSSTVDYMMRESTAQEMRQKIKDNTTFDPSYYGGKYDLPITTGTTHLVVVGPSGDAASVTSTVNGYLGAKFRSCELGFIYNNEMDDFSIPNMPNEFGLPPAEINFIGPRKRPQSSSVPVIILDEDKNVRMTLGGSGGSIITTATAQVMMHHLWFGKSLKDAVQEPRVHHQLIPNRVFVESRMPESIVQGLKQKGHQVERGDESHAVVQAIARITDDWKHNWFRKGHIHKAHPELYAESDFRKGGKPAGF